jgi:hypothetical protein
MKGEMSMSVPNKAKPKHPEKVRIMPNPAKAQTFKKAMEETHKQYAETLARLAK